jgi:NADP-dependent 3-hydroxy acid dehydrogenase YdfG
VRVHALARRADRLAALAEETGCIPHAVDVTDTAAIEALIPGLGADILVNNAGLGRGIEGLAATNAADIEVTVATNVTAVLHLLRLALPGMAEGGNVVNIGSIAGLYPAPWAVYGATKGAIRQLSRNLRLELKGKGPRVTDIQPGRVSTEFYDVSLDDPAARAQVKDTGVEELSPEDVAAAVMFAINAPAHVNVSAIELQPVGQLIGGSVFSND